jgi:hypothetical protein
VLQLQAAMRFIAVLLFLLTACEQGYEIRGFVDTAAVPDKDRPFRVLLVTPGWPADHTVEATLVDLPAVPAAGVDFSHEDAAGCLYTDVAVVAWAPSEPREKPGAGDYLTITPFRGIDCGWGENLSTFDLELDGDDLVP